MLFDRWPAVVRGVVVATIAGWILVLAQDRGLFLPSVCAMTVLTPKAALASLDLALALNPPARLAAGWALMLPAMMAPLMAMPLQHVHHSSLPRRRLELIILFVIGYGAVWLAAGAVLMPLAIVLRLVAPSPWIAVALVTLPLLAWHGSPGRQRCLNRRHGRPPLPAFGVRAAQAALGFGAAQGVWCVGACWGVMLLPVVIPHGHLATMAAVAVWQFADHLEGPRPLRWRWRWPLQTASTVLWLVRSLAPLRGTGRIGDRYSGTRRRQPGGGGAAENPSPSYLPGSSTPSPPSAPGR